MTNLYMNLFDSSSMDTPMATGLFNSMFSFVNEAMSVVSSKMANFFKNGLARASS